MLVYNIWMSWPLCSEDYSIQQETPKDGWKVQWPKSCEYNNQDDYTGLNRKTCNKTDTWWWLENTVAEMYVEQSNVSGDGASIFQLMSGNIL